MNRALAALGRYWRWSGSLHPWEAMVLARYGPFILLLLVLSLVMVAMEEDRPGDPPAASYVGHPARLEV